MQDPEEPKTTRRHSSPPPPLPYLMNAAHALHYEKITEQLMHRDPAEKYYGMTEIQNETDISVFMRWIPFFIWLINHESRDIRHTYVRANAAIVLNNLAGRPAVAAHILNTKEHCEFLCYYLKLSTQPDIQRIIANLFLNLLSHVHRADTRLESPNFRMLFNALHYFQAGWEPTCEEREAFSKAYKFIHCMTAEDHATTFEHELLYDLHFDIHAHLRSPSEEIREMALKHIELNLATFKPSDRQLIIRELLIISELMLTSKVLNVLTQFAQEEHDARMMLSNLSSLNMFLTPLQKESSTPEEIDIRRHIARILWSFYRFGTTRGMLHEFFPEFKLKFGNCILHNQAPGVLIPLLDIAIGLKKTDNLRKLNPKVIEHLRTLSHSEDDELRVRANELLELEEPSVGRSIGPS